MKLACGKHFIREYQENEGIDIQGLSCFKNASLVSKNRLRCVIRIRLKNYP